MNADGGSIRVRAREHEPTLGVYCPGDLDDEVPGSSSSVATRRA